MQKINTETSALLVMDCQGSIVNSLPPSEKERIFGSLPKVIAAARAKGMPWPAALRLPLRAALSTCFPVQEQMLGSEDAKEGPTAFAEKRKP